MALLSPFDHLYCQEENLEFDEEVEEGMAPVLPLPEDCETECHILSVAEAEAEEEWTEVLCSLVAKEGGALPKLVPDGGFGSYLRSARREAVEWVALAAARHAFSALTALLAVNYLDQCFLSCGAAGGGLLRLQDDKPWMGRLAAVACLSLAAKVEETRLPLLLDLQVPLQTKAATEEEGGYVFEPKTIRRMELLVLSVLGWKMNPVTPLSFIYHLLPRLCSKAKIADADFAAAGIATRGRALMRRCEAALLSVIAGRLSSKCLIYTIVSISSCRHHRPNAWFVSRRQEMGSVSVVGLGCGGAAPGDGVRRRRHRSGEISRGPPPHFPPQHPKGKGGGMLSATSGISGHRHCCPQAQAYVLRFLPSFIATQSQWGYRILLQQRELMRFMADVVVIHVVLTRDSSFQETQSLGS
ncbi:hypothetical protein BHE74_00003951 [Ensete ventricosum]|nr:hypothetical protein BHE74_00003951 [Ensete ventricosum]